MVLFMSHLERLTGYLMVFEAIHCECGCEHIYIFISSNIITSRFKFSREFLLEECELNL